MNARVVHKFPIPPIELGITLELPASSRFAHFAEQHGALTVWVDRPVEDDPAPTTFDFVVRGTGHPIPPSTGEPWQHLASTLVDGGAYVFHLYGRSRPCP